MVCRISGWLTIGLLIVSAGCTKSLLNSSPATGTPVAVVPPGAEIKREGSLPKRAPKASTCVAFGNFIAAEAGAVNQTPDIRRQKIDSGFKAYQQGLEIDPKNLDAYLGIARLHATAGDLDKAAAAYEQALKLHPKCAPVWYELGMNRSRKKDWNAALKALAKAVELAPDDAQYANNYGFALARAGRYDDSLTCFTKLHGEAKAHYNLARMLAHLEKPELCRSHLHVALLKDPRLESAKTMLAQLDVKAAVPALPRPAVPEQKPAVVVPVISTSATPVITDVQPAAPLPLPPPPQTFTPAQRR